MRHLRNIIGWLFQLAGLPGVVKPIKYFDEVLGKDVEVSTSRYYTKISIGGRDLFFDRHNGKFDGTGCHMHPCPE